jgi:flagellar biosynthetic protein FliO
MKVIAWSLVFLTFSLSQLHAQMPSAAFGNEGSDVRRESATAGKRTRKTPASEMQKPSESAQQEASGSEMQEAETQPPSTEKQSTPFQIVESDAGSEHATPAEQIPELSSGEMGQAEMQVPLIRALGGLGLVMFLIIAIYFGAKKFAPRYFSKASADKSLKVMETLSMGDKRSISLIEVAGNRFLVGNTAHQINLLAALPESAGLISDPKALPAQQTPAIDNESKTPFRKLFEVEKNGLTRQKLNPLPDDVRAKMRQLREALER